jgi:uncharacterized LabA/DUF88 family protein
MQVEANSTRIFLLSADSDFKDSVEKLKNLGKKVHLVTFDRTDSKIHPNFIECCDSHIRFDYEKCVKNGFIKRF